MIRFALAFLIFFIGCASSALAGGRADRLKECQVLADCLTILDAAIPKEDVNPPLTVYWPYLPASPQGDVNALLGDEREIAEILQRFGEPAKRELLHRAAGAHRGWRHLAGEILKYWQVWSPSDVPALRAALRHAGGVARPLGEIGTPEAIQALVDDLTGTPSGPTWWALDHLGARALPYLFLLLENEQESWKAESVIRGMGAESLAFAPDWVSLATNPDRPKSTRLAALRGLAAMGGSAMPYTGPIRAMLADADADLRDQAFKTLAGFHDPAVAAFVAERCTPSAGEFERFSNSTNCIRDVTAFGDNGRAAGPSLMKFFESRNGDELATAVGALGYIGYSEAIPAIRRSLGSHDWRVVLASVQSLGWLGAVEAIPHLERIASSYWLPEVRDEALAVLRALKGSERKMAKPPTFAKANLGMDPFRKRHEYNCPSERWEWQGVPFPRPQSTHRGLHSIPLGGGTLYGTNFGEGGELFYGEWAAQLYWGKGKEEAQTIVRDGVWAIEPADGGAIVLFGFAHLGVDYGYVVHVSQRADGGWSLIEVGRLPGVPEALADIGPNLFAV